jgi:hypothetical protein
MEQGYWLEFPNGARQLIDPSRFDMVALVSRAAALGGRLVLAFPAAASPVVPQPGVSELRRFDPPISALGPLFISRFERIHTCRIKFHLDINARATIRVLGGYYRRRRLVRIYARDRGTGRRPLEELFDTFLHEMAHHLEYTEPDSFDATFCGRVPGLMHSALFWRILGQLKRRWRELQGALLAPSVLSEASAAGESLGRSNEPRFGEKSG